MSKPNKLLAVNARSKYVGLCVGFFGRDKMVKRTGTHGRMQLSESKIKRLSDPGFYSDGGSLYLKIDAGGSKRWVQRVMLKNGPRIDIGLGSYDPISIDEVRRRAEDNKDKARRGVDPRKVATVYLADTLPTFGQVARHVYELRKGDWKNPKHAAQWISTLETYAFPTIGQMRIDQIDTAYILRVLAPIWSEKRETASRVKQRMSSVFDYAISQGHRNNNPVLAKMATLPSKKPNIRHQPAVPYDQIGDALTLLKTAQKAWKVTKLCIEFIVLTGVRSGEARNATWKEFDLETNVWTIPVERMKMSRSHRVPLSTRVIEILAEARQLSDGKGLVFPSRQDREKPLSDNTLSKLMRDRKVPSYEAGVPAVVHGFRATLRIWLAECRPDVPHRIAEQILAHEEKNKVVRAYQRSDLLEQRVKIMQDWCDYVEKLGIS